MKTRKVALKIKIKSLAEEAAIIRIEEKKNKDLRMWLADHRRGTVRRTAFESQLAYGFLRGRDFKVLTSNCKTSINWASVKKMVYAYGVYQHDCTEAGYKQYTIDKHDQDLRFEVWMKTAKE